MSRKSGTRFFTTAPHEDDARVEKNPRFGKTSPTRAVEIPKGPEQHPRGRNSGRGVCRVTHRFPAPDDASELALLRPMNPFERCLRVGDLRDVPPHAPVEQESHQARKRHERNEAEDQGPQRHLWRRYPIF
jgi:hypothetical protein